MNQDKQEEAKKACDGKKRVSPGSIAMTNYTIPDFQSRLLEEIEKREKEVNGARNPFNYKITIGKIIQLDWFKELILTIKP